MNLIINGAEAIPEGRSGNVVVSTSVQKPAEYPQSSLRPRESETAGIYVDLQVSDNGCGMDEETKRKIFDPFFTTKFTGRGLGLAAVLGIVRGHKGSISVSSTPGQGSVFTVSLPATLNKIAEDSPPDAATKVGGNERILVVDDEPMVRGIATIVLTRAGYSVVEAEDGQRAVEVFQREGDQIALVLLDLTMPVMGGDTAIQHLRKIRPDCRILLSSGYSEIDIIQRLGNEEVAGFIQKPYTGSRLLHKVKTVLEQSSSRSADASQKNV